MKKKTEPIRSKQNLDKKKQYQQNKASPLAWVSDHWHGSLTTGMGLRPTVMDFRPQSWISDHCSCHGFQTTGMGLRPLAWVSDHWHGFQTTVMGSRPLSWISDHCSCHGFQTTVMGFRPQAWVSDHCHGSQIPSFQLSRCIHRHCFLNPSLEPEPRFTLLVTEFA